MAAPLVADHVLEYPGGYTRSVGPVIGRFLTSLRDGRIEGVRISDGRVLVPPTEYDPTTGEDLHELVEVGPGGVVTTWSWVAAPLAKHPVERPFAWALIQPDGADAAMLGAVDVGSADAMSSGMRVEPVWADEREGSITDLRCWRPVDG